MSEEKSIWDELCGERMLNAITTDIKHPFCTEAQGVALYLDDMTVFVFEDPSDGYRSSATTPIMVKAPLYEFGHSPEYIHAPMLIRPWTKSDYGDGANGVEFIDRRNGKTVLRLGTDNSDDYYPSFICDWKPENLAENAKG